MKRLGTLIILLISTTLFAQIEVTDKGNVDYLMKQINSLYFEKHQENEYVATVGRVKEMQIFWLKIVDVNSITYVQILVNRKLGMKAEGHTITTDLYGNNATGTHEKQLKYERL